MHVTPAETEGQRPQPTSHVHNGEEGAPTNQVLGQEGVNAQQRCPRDPSQTSGFSLHLLLLLFVKMLKGHPLKFIHS